MMKVLLIVLAGLASSGLANAAITVALDGSPTVDGPDFLWTYQISVDSLEKLVAEPGASFFTIYDFAGYVPGSISAPADWTTEFSPSGPGMTNSTQTPPEPTFDDLTFIYTGPPSIVNGPVNLTGFSAVSTSGNVNTGGVFTYQANNAVGVDAGIGSIDVPTPEPSMSVLVGLGLIGVGLKRRKELRKS
jgi:hypothetical protein